MTIVACPDSFKGSLGAAEAATALALGARSVFGPGANIIELPLADGGEGSLDALLAAWGSNQQTLSVHDAIGRPATARFGVSADGRTGMIEAAEANGLPQVSDVPLQPLRADSRGVGEIAVHLLNAGITEIMLFIGGSASTDGGTGFLNALGVRFLDAAGFPVAPGGGGLADIARIDPSGLHPAASAACWELAVDVSNPICGPRGAAAVFGPQKGAGADDVSALDAGLEHLARILAAQAGIDAAEFLEREGLGAAGGLPACLVALLGARTVPGSTLVSEALDLEGLLADADLVLTGEGRLDSQSLGGKVVDAVRRLSPADTPVIVIAGTVELDSARCRAEGITAAFSIARGPATLAALSVDTASLVRDAAAQACSLLGFSTLSTRAYGKPRSPRP
ncbi:glycerate kinase [Paeniglutamicibacter cryotolerans]|nr:glycerate kinase [Paeniglutamicibacter cryotolerans]